MSLALRTPGWTFHIVRGGIEPEDPRFRPRFVVVVDVWKEFLIRVWNAIFPGWCWLMVVLWRLAIAASGMDLNIGFGQ